MRFRTLLLLLAASTGCAESAPARIAVRDSAGVRIIEHPPEAVIPSWFLAEAPEVKIGVVGGDPRYEFGVVRSAIRLDDGRFVVLDRTAKRVSIFSSRGEFLHAHGGEGSGPGEYIDPTALWRLPGDSLAVLDARAGRVSVLSPDAEWVRSATVRVIDPSALPHGSFANGKLLLLDQMPDLDSFGLADYWAVWPRGMDSIGRFRSQENIEPTNVMRITTGSLPLISQFRLVAAGSASLFTARNFGYELEVRDTSAVVRRIVRWHGRDLAVTPEGVERFKQAILEDVPESRRPERRRSLEQHSVNERYPAFSAIVIDRLDRAWLQSYRQPFDEGPAHWTIVGRDGGLLGEIEMPEGVAPLDIGEGYVLARERDELDVQYVVLYRVKPAA